jgi:AMMECR1 domain-containing protein
VFPLFLFIGVFLAGPAWAQAEASFPKLKGQEKKVLLLIAREALNAAQEGRPSREARVDPRLQASQPLVLSLYVDDQLRARAWRLKGLQPIYTTARDLVQTALSDPKVSDKPLDREEMARAKIGLAVLGRYAPAKDETEIPPRSAVIIYNGFIEWLALPEDVPGGKAADILSYACSQAGLRPQVWLLPTTTIFHAPAEELKE